MVELRDRANCFAVKYQLRRRASRRDPRRWIARLAGYFGAFAQ